MHPDPPDPLRVGEPDVGPGVPAVGGPVDAVPDGRAVARIVLSRAQVHHVRVRGRERDRSQGQGPAGLEDRGPGHAMIGRAPEPSGRRREVHRRRVAGDRRDVHGAPAHLRRTDRPPLETGHVASAGQPLSVRRLRSEERDAEGEGRQRGREGATRCHDLNSPPGCGPRHARAGALGRKSPLGRSSGQSAEGGARSPFTRRWRHARPAWGEADSDTIRPGRLARTGRATSDRPAALRFLRPTARRGRPRADGRPDPA